MRLRIAALGVGIAELQSAMGRSLLRLIISMSELFAVRDDAAMAECVRAGAGERAILTSDLVYTMSSQLREAAPELQEKGSPLIAVSVYAPALLGPADGDRMTIVMRAALQTVLERGWRVLLLAFHHAADESNAHLDLAALAKLAESLPAQYRAQVVQKILRADDIPGIASAFAGIDLHCGMRFHGHVISEIFDKPFVGIAVDNKIDAICRSFGMPVVQIKDFSSDSLVQAVDQAMASRIDPSQRASCEHDAAKNFSQLAVRLSAVNAVA